jgi:hypothetical protein
VLPGAEISAAKHKRGRKKILAQTFGRFIKKNSRKKAKYLVVWFFTKTILFSTEKFNFQLLYSIFPYRFAL